MGPEEITMAESPRLTLGTRISLAGAAVWGVLLIGVGFLPTYESESVSSTGVVTRSSETLVSENGAGVLLLLAIPLLVTIVVIGALVGLPRRAGLALAWTLTGLVGAFTTLGMLTIGIFVMPAAVALVVACTLRTVTPPVWPAPVTG